MTYKLFHPDPHGESWVEFRCDDPAYTVAMAQSICRELDWNYAATRLEVADGKL